MTLLTVQGAVRLINGLGGRTDAEELLQEARKVVDEDIVHQTISKCIISGREAGVIDYDTDADPTKIWTQ